MSFLKVKCHKNYIGLCHVCGINYIVQVSGNDTVILNRCKCRVGKSQQYKLRVKPDKQTFTHMEFSDGQLRNTRPAGHLSTTLNATINSNVYRKINARAPKAPTRAIKAKFTAMCDTLALMCIMGRSMLSELKMNKSELIKVTSNW